MGLSASQARFLQLTARKSNDEYRAQQISFQRLQLSTALEDASTAYENKTTNTKLVYQFNDGTGRTSIDVTYNNYKNYMNQQLPGLTTAQDKLYLVSSSGNKIVVASEEEKQAMIEANTTYMEVEEKDNQNTSTDDTTNKETNLPMVVKKDEDGNEKTYYVERKFSENDFMIVDDLDDNDAFKRNIQEGVFFFAKYEFYIFGSRAKGTYKSTSDIDIAIFEDVKEEDKFKIMNEFDLLDIVYKIDLVFVTKDTKEELVKSIKKYKIKL